MIREVWNLDKYGTNTSLLKPSTTFIFIFHMLKSNMQNCHNLARDDHLTEVALLTESTSPFALINLSTKPTQSSMQELSSRDGRTDPK